MKVTVEKDTCIGDGTCVEICSDVFEMDDEVATVRIDEVPEDFESACREAADACPVEAIIIEE